jgi:hypothetical protein
MDRLLRFDIHSDGDDLACGDQFITPTPYPALPFLTIALSSSATGGGTGPPTILVTAPNLEGQTSKQVPHLMHIS